ncbi:MAG: hypothetical protein O2867_01165 [Bacteroidetes bacterium]|nr:hypothetical protein [Bacteroidota bacterium]
MKHVLTVLIPFFILSSASAQPFNVLDDQGRKQGDYKKFFEGTEQVFYIGQFKDDLPYGHFQYYFREGGKKADMFYRPGGKDVFSITYYPAGGKMGEGKYISQAKDSVWNYYDEEQRLTSTEDWVNGKKSGVERVYFPTGILAEELYWKEDLRHGPWNQFFEDGKPYLKGNFVNDVYDGEMTFYFPNGKKEIYGKCVNGMREGTWWYYNKDGSVRNQMLYRRGEVEKEKKENGTFYEYGPDNIILSEVTYKNGVKEGPFAYYYDDASFELVEEVDPRTGEKYMKEVKTGNGVKMSGLYKTDELHGTVRHFNEAGVLIKEEHYELGVLK